MKLVATFYLVGGLCFFFQDQAVQHEPFKHLIILIILIVVAALLTKFVHE